MSSSAAIDAAVAAPEDGQHSQAAAAVVKEQGGANDLIARLKMDKDFAAADIDAAIEPGTLTGRSKEQVDEFVDEIVAPIKKRYANLTTKAEVRV